MFNLSIICQKSYYDLPGNFTVETIITGLAMANPVDVCVDFVVFTGLPYGNPVGKWIDFRFIFFSIFFRVGKSLACHSPAKWCLCA